MYWKNERLLIIISEYKSGREVKKYLMKLLGNKNTDGQRKQILHF